MRFQHTVKKLHLQLEQTSLPHGLLLSGNLALPFHQVQACPVLRLRRLSDEAEGVVFTPLLAEFVQHQRSCSVDMVSVSHAYRSSCSRAMVSDMLHLHLLFVGVINRLSVVGPCRRSMSVEMLRRKVVAATGLVYTQLLTPM